MTAPRLAIDFKLVIAAVLAALLAAAAMATIDTPVARACLAGELPGDVEKGINLAEAFAHGVGVAFICIAFWALDPRRHLFPRLIALPLLTGLAGNLSKLLIARSRPHQFPVSEFPSAIETIHGFPGSLDDPLQSLPSGHAATAVGLAVALTRLYPRAWPLFATFAILAAVQRIANSAHFVSDVLAGAAVALAVASLVTNRLFWDAAWGGRPG